MSGEKTEEPSHKKLRDAKEQGNVPKSKDFQTALIFGASCWMLPGVITDSAREIQSFSAQCFASTSEQSGRLEALTLDIAFEGVRLMLVTILPLLGTVFIVALVSGIVTTGGV